MTTAATAPTGVVTLVFTDIEGSTKLWEEQAGAMGEALRLHNALVRGEIARHHGFEVKTEGDAFMIAFASTLDAIRCCLVVQEALLEVHWPVALLNTAEAARVLAPSGEVLWKGLRVRMGVHLGAPVCHVNPVTGRMDYVGPMVNRAARIAGAGHGGQILLSGEVWHAAQPALSELGEPAVTAMGSHALKGLKAPEELVQLLPRRLQGRSFPRLKTLSLNASAADQNTAAPEDHFVELLGDMPTVDMWGNVDLGKRPEASATAPTLASAPKLELDLSASKPTARRAPVEPRRTARPRRAATVVAVIIALAAVGGVLWHQGVLERMLFFVAPQSGAAASGPQPANMTVLYVVTQPAGAAVTLNGKKIGVTPLAVENTFGPGEVTLVLHKAGYAAKSVRVRGGTNAEVHETLERK